MTPRDEQRACYFLIFPLFMCGVSFFFFFFFVSWRNFIFQITWMAGSWRVQIQSRQTFCDCFLSSCYFLSVFVVAVFCHYFAYTITFHPELELQYIRCILIWWLSIAFRLNVLMAFIILFARNKQKKWFLKVFQTPHAAVRNQYLRVIMDFWSSEWKKQNRSIKIHILIEILR